MPIEREKYEAMLSRISRLMDVQHFDKALKEIFDTLALSPDDSHLYQKAGYCEFRLGRYEAAKELYKRSLSLDPQNVVAHNLMGYLYMMQYNYIACLDHFNRALEIEPSNTHSFGGIASMYEQLNDWDKALEYSNKALAIDPNRTSSLNTRSKALSELGRIEESDETIRQSLSREPEASSTQATYGWTLVRSGKGDEALEAFRNALRISPNNEYAQDGFLEALKMKNWILRQMVLFEIWITSWSQSTTNIFIGTLLTLLIFPPMMLDGTTKAEYGNAILAYRYGIMILLISRYIVNPISNIFLLPNRDGRLAMNAVQVRVACAAGVSLLMMLIGIETSFHSDHDIWLLLALYGMYMLFALGAYFRHDYPPTRKARMKMLLGFILCGAASLFFGFFEWGIAGFFTLFPLGVILLTIWDSGKEEDPSFTSSKH